jgi:hypothetical protein
VIKMMMTKRTIKKRNRSRVLQVAALVGRVKIVPQVPVKIKDVVPVKNEAFDFRCWYT